MKYNIILCDSYGRSISSFANTDLDMCIKELLYYKKEELYNKGIIYTYSLLVNDKIAEKEIWDIFCSKYIKFDKIQRKLYDLEKDFE